MVTLAAAAKHLFRLAFGVAGGYLFFRFGDSIQAPQLTNITGMLATICSTLLGFVITAVALITAIMDRTLISNMQKTKHYNVLMKGAFVTCTILFFATIFCIVNLFLPENLLRYGFTISIAVCTISFIYLFETGRRFAIVVLSL